MTAATAFMAKEGRAQGADGLFRVDEDGGGKRKVSLLDAKVGLALVGVARKTCTNKLLVRAMIILMPLAVIIADETHPTLTTGSVAASISLGSCTYQTLH